ADRDVSQRDGFVARNMNLQQFPNATFTASSVSVTPAASGSAVDVSLPGMLTIHGVTKDVTATAKAQLTGNQVEVAGSVAIDMTDYGVSPPSVPFTTVDSQVTIEVDVALSRNRSIRRLRVCALDESDRGFEGQHPVNVRGGAIEVRLQAHADRGVARVDAVVQVERAVRVRAALHVDPQEALGFGGRIGQPAQVGEGRLGVDVEADLGGLDRDLRLEAGRSE